MRQSVGVHCGAHCWGPCTCCLSTALAWDAYRAEEQVLAGAQVSWAEAHLAWTLGPAVAPALQAAMLTAHS